MNSTEGIQAVLFKILSQAQFPRNYGIKIYSKIEEWWD